MKNLDAIGGISKTILQIRRTRELLRLQAERNALTKAGDAGRLMQIGRRIIELRRELGFGADVLLSAVPADSPKAISALNTVEKNSHAPPQKSRSLIAKAMPNQPTWRDKNLPDLKTLAAYAEVTPPLLAGAVSAEMAVNVVRTALGMPEGGQLSVETPLGNVVIRDGSLAHVVDKRQDQRERYASLVLPTLRRPTEVWSVKYDDGSTRNRYIKLFSGMKYDMLVMVKLTDDGSVFWNMMNRERAGMNALRIGELKWKSH